MKVYDKPIDVRKQEDGTFTVSVAISDSVIVVKTVSLASMQQLYITLENVLKEEDAE